MSRLATGWLAQPLPPASCSLVPWCVRVVCLSVRPSVRPFPQVLKKYPRLWCMAKPPSRRPKLYIVNLQVTGEPAELPPVPRALERESQDPWGFYVPVSRATAFWLSGGRQAGGREPAAVLTHPLLSPVDSEG